MCFSMYAHKIKNTYQTFISLISTVQCTGRPKIRTIVQSDDIHFVTYGRNKLRHSSTIHFLINSCWFCCTEF